MLKVGYFSHTNFSPSETFVYDLVKALNLKPNIDLSYISGLKTPINVDFKINSFVTGYFEKQTSLATRLYKLGQLKGEKGYGLKMRFQQWIAFHSLQKKKLPKFDVAYVEYATSAVMLMKYFETKQIPYVVHVHGYDVTSCLNDPAYAKQLNVLFENGAHIITPSKHIKRLLISLGCNPEKITPIYPVTNIESITPLPWNERFTRQPSVTFLGRLTDKKNPLALLHAFQIVSKELPNVKFNILGDGPLKRQIEERIKQLGLTGKVNLTGSVNREVAFKYLQESWVYAQHSVTSITGDQEGFPVSMAEAAAHALPIVSTIHSGITENIIDGETGFLVQEYDFEKMAEKIIYLIKHPELAEQMGKAGRDHIISICKPHDRVEKIIELLQKVSS